jgi:hypothetical protein
MSEIIGILHDYPKTANMDEVIQVAFSHFTFSHTDVHEMIMDYRK